MFALLDIKRAGAELHLLKKYQVPHEQAGKGYLWMCLPDREFDLSQDAQAFIRNAAWVNSRTPPYPELTDVCWGVGFALGHWTIPLSWQASTFSLDLINEFQFPLSEKVRDRYVLAVIGFSGEKHGGLLPSRHPVHGVITAFFEAVQPIYALAIGDTIWPSEAEDADFFREPWRRDDRYTNMYYGPELLPFIPPELLSPSAGLGHVERLGGGVWVTLPGWSTVSFKVPDSLYEPHRAALRKINAVLRQRPTPPWAE
ncbi:hypothetical protein [Deinococcus aestuarii]|uniref:hypothetical protein n=1 Tax=Deinococcus aestuarii TaxID=2774531 RepID=UPI001C0CDA41|nr:hypothetical protein [Deinococcus aestuarii]